MYHSIKLSLLIALTTGFGALSAQQTPAIVQPVPQPGAQAATQTQAAPQHQVGEAGALFNQANCGDCGDCGGCGAGGCGIGGGGGPLSGLRSRLSGGLLGGNRCDPYLSLFGGWSDLHNYFATDANGAPAGSAGFNDGYILGFARGHALGCNSRIEWESSLRNNTGVYDNDTLTPLDGQINNYSGMLNVLRDFRVGCNVTPYVGGGVGFSRQDGDFLYDGQVAEIEDWAFAYQAIAGISFKRNECTELYAEYRYFANSETEFEVATTGAAPTSGDFDYLGESIVFGIRMKR